MRYPIHRVIDDAVKELDQNIANETQTLDLLTKALPAIKAYASKNKLANKRLIASLSEAGIYASLSGQYGGARLYLSAKEGNARAELWPDRKEIEEHGKLSVFFEADCGKRIEWTKDRLERFTRDRANLPELVAGIESIRATIDSLAESIGYLPDHAKEGGAKELSYALRDILKAGLEL